ncbi:tRNA-uridine aminocarboxypropyltransferase [Alteromonas gilva]|uniref:tRNA-uridine aminocarboxypropyltransferase n=1 Tax=Alteromonas gilva TaxID=2987522 RepID=A0ABT5KWP0_9ALTE|nr:tRNA-uridine aminocarboxypropyltransferase [Alteromonas gilva]MDC8829184.1 DTW domain-containing protein [Alteromonas gilva]
MRQCCSDCGYPLKTCLCQDIAAVNNQAEIIILQHPKEASHAKNTVRLLTHSLAKIKIYVGKSAIDFSSLQELLRSQPLNTVVLYPSPNSQVLNITEARKTKIERVIFIDGSWKQAYGMWKNNEWLNRFPFYKLALPNAGQYAIRKSKLDISLSTLEAVAYSLNTIEQLDTKPLLQLLTSFTRRWQSFVQRSKDKQ